MEKNITFYDGFYLVQCLCSGLQALHRQGYAHMDLKPENIFIHKGHPVIGDLGSSISTMDCHSGFMSGRSGSPTTLWYRSYLTSQYWDAGLSFDCLKSEDIFSLGVVVCFIFFKRHPFMERDIISHIKRLRLCMGQPLTADSDYLRKNSRARCSMSEQSQSNHVITTDVLFRRWTDILRGYELHIDRSDGFFLDMQWTRAQIARLVSMCLTLTPVNRTNLCDLIAYVRTPLVPPTLA